MEFNDQQNQSEFNMAFAYFGRINQAIFLANMSSSSLDAYNWYLQLRILFRELSTQMSEKEKEPLEKELFSISPFVNDQVQKSQRQGRNYLDEDCYKKLHDMEVKLRLVIKKSGMELKMKADPRFAI